MLAIDLPGLAPWFVLTVTVIAFLLIDLLAFARGRKPTFRAGAAWSLGWLLISLAAAGVVLVVEDGLAAVNYTTVYLIERSLSLDNLFVFLLLFGYFRVRDRDRATLLFWGIIAALVLRALAILGGVALIERFHFVVYLLGAALLLLAYRILRGMDENVDPARNLFVRAVRRLYPVDTDTTQGRWFVRRDGVRHVTPLFLCLVAIVFADITFAVDSIPAAFAITRDPLLIWMGNAFALLGLSALFVLVEWLIRRFRYLDQTIAIVLALVALKLLLEDVYELGPLASLAILAATFGCGIAASIVADRRDPLADEKRGERDRRVTAAHMGSTR
jgi:TerC family integral membrane protein